MEEIGPWLTGSSGRCSMEGIGPCSTGSSGRCSMRDIGLVVFRSSEIFLEIMPKSSRGPHTNSSALKEIAIFRKSQGATHEMGSASARGLPRNIYKRSGVDGERVQQYTRTAGLVPSRGVISNPSHTLFYRNSGIFYTIAATERLD